MIRLQRIWEKDEKLKYYLDQLEPNSRVLLIFWHGLGDLVMFLNPFVKLQSLYPKIKIDLAVQKGLGFEEVTNCLVNTEVLLIDGDFLKTLSNEYEIIADIDFPMSEGQIELTKGEYCCVHELGITPVCGHMELDCGKNRLIGVHFNITCLPGACNPDKETAEMIWNDILEEGFIPIETHFQHVFHNPVNKKFDFVDCTVRRVRPQVSSLVGLLKQCRGFVGVVSGNLHTALSVKKPEDIFFLEKDFKIECFTKNIIAKASIKPKEYNHEIKEWLKTLK